MQSPRIGGVPEAAGSSRPPAQLRARPERDLEGLSFQEGRQLGALYTGGWEIRLQGDPLTTLDGHVVARHELPGEYVADVASERDMVPYVPPADLVIEFANLPTRIASLPDLAHTGRDQRVTMRDFVPPPPDSDNEGGLSRQDWDDLQTRHRLLADAGLLSTPAGRPDGDPDWEDAKQRQYQVVDRKPIRRFLRDHGPLTDSYDNPTKYVEFMPELGERGELVEGTRPQPTRNAFEYEFTRPHQMVNEILRLAGAGETRRALDLAFALFHTAPEGSLLIVLARQAIALAFGEFPPKRCAACRTWFTVTKDESQAHHQPPGWKRKDRHVKYCSKRCGNRIAQRKSRARKKEEQQTSGQGR